DREDLVQLPENRVDQIEVHTRYVERHEGILIGKGSPIDSPPRLVFPATSELVLEKTSAVTRKLCGAQQRRPAGRNAEPASVKVERVRHGVITTFRRDHDRHAQGAELPLDGVSVLDDKLAADPAERAARLRLWPGESRAA